MPIAVLKMQAHLKNAIAECTNSTTLLRLLISLPQTNARPIRKHPRCHVHRRELLEQQLGRIRNDHLRNLRLIATRPTLELSLAELRDRSHQTADLADVHAERIADLHQTLLQER